MIDDTQLRNDIDRLEQSIIKYDKTCIRHQSEILNSYYCNDNISALLAYRENLEIYLSKQKFEEENENIEIQHQNNGKNKNQCFSYQRPKQNKKNLFKIIKNFVSRLRL